MKLVQWATALGLTILALGQGAFAERYLIVLKDKAVFAKTNSQVRAGVRLASVQWTVGNHTVSPFEKAGVEVEQSLEHFQTLVINADNESQIAELKATGLVGLIEKEIFHPAPAPVEGYERTQAWTFDLNYDPNYALPQPMASLPRGRRPAFGDGGLGPKTPWGITAVRAPQAWPMAKQGLGARVLVLDTGIDRDHPALKANFEGGKDFTGSGGTPYDYVDLVGHGTHCAGTIAAAMGADGFVGVAPKARLLAGRVCGEQGCSNISVAAGMNWAIQQKVDVVSMSLGGPVGTPAEQKAVEALEAAGISVVAASGNDGKPTVSYPAAFSTVIAVGAIDRFLTKAKFSNWGPELSIVGPGVDVISSVPRGTGRQAVVAIDGKPVNASSFGGSPLIPNPLSNELVFSGLGKPADYPSAVAGKFALVSRGEIPFAEKVKNALAAGAAGVVIFNNEPGLINGALGFEIQIPVVMIEQTIGQQIKVALDQGQTVLAAVQTTPADYASFSGTSMATPHVAGVVALVKAANKNLAPALVKSILKASAQPMQPNAQNELGAGLVNAEAAVKAALSSRGPGKP
jgi:subtilisin family serine protease